MIRREEQGYIQDIAAGAALILIGIVLMIDRMGTFIIRYTPVIRDLQQWWPLLLIGAGVVLVITELLCAPRLTSARGDPGFKDRT